ncbi:unnamed protein product, partial [Linum tenue]
MSIPCMLVSKVGDDFWYPVNHPLIVSPGTKTIVFHACFDSGLSGSGRPNRVLKRICSWDTILPAIGVAGEKMI